MRETTRILTILLICKACAGQFFYNYERDESTEPQVSEEAYDPSQYQYIPPSAVDERYSRYPQPETQVAQKNKDLPHGHRQQVNVVEAAPDDQYYRRGPQETQYVEPQGEPRSTRRNIRRQRQRSKNTLSRNQAEIRQPPRQYSPSVFLNIGPGEAPSGVNIPEDSLLNVLRSDNPANFNQPRRAPIQYTLQQVSPEVPSSRPLQDNGRSRQGTEIEEIYENYFQQRSQYSPPEIYEPQKEVRSNRRNIRTQRVSSISGNIKQVDLSHAQRQYAPSVFANIGLGEAPSGVDVPQDSLLNVLRTNSQPHYIPQASSVHPTISSQGSPETRERNYENQRTSNERQLKQVYPRPQAPDDYATYFQPQPQEEIISRRTQQSTRVAPTSQQHRKRDDASRGKAPPPPQKVYEAQENFNKDYEADIIRQRPRNTDHRRRQQYTSGDAATPSTRQNGAFKTANLAIAALPDDVDEDGIPGQARADYPTLHVIPTTSFSCAEQPHNGYYADLETSCQVVHLCQAGGVQSSFLCPNGTIFSQEKFSCQWWYKVDCANSPKFYGINDNLYKVPPRPSRKKSS